MAGAPRVLEATEFLVMEMSFLEYNKGAPDFHRTIDALADLGFLALDLFELNRDPRGWLEQADMIFVRAGSRFRRRSPRR